MPGLKKAVYTKCLSIIAEKRLILEGLLGQNRESTQSETKSSAGDKHETGRASAHLEAEKLHKQLLELHKLERAMHQIDPTTDNKQVQTGSLIYTNNGIFYISVGLGKIEVQEIAVFAISPVSPIGKALMGLKAGDSIVFNGRDYRLDEVR